ncbi:MAG TPA: hypothetical protein VKV73_00820 [Chloroflexota bacterium]|nr:hypothetical protein [Chloroflexota bacterium]
MNQNRAPPLAKLAVQGRTEAVAFALQNQLVFLIAPAVGKTLAAR